jgi:hypothetical protein
MSNVLRCSFLGLVFCWVVSIVGCGGDSLRVVEETDELSFDEMAAQAAAETALSSEEE